MRTEAPGIGRPLTALVTVPRTGSPGGSGVSAIEPAEMDVPATTVTARVVEVKPEALIARVRGPGVTPLSVKLPSLLVVVRMDVPFTATVALERVAPVPTLVTVPVTVPVVMSIKMTSTEAACPAVSVGGQCCSFGM